MAEDEIVIFLPVIEAEERTCFNCVHDSDVIEVDDFGVESVRTWCTAYQELIDSETYAAEDCPTYQRRVE